MLIVFLLARGMNYFIGFDWTTNITRIEYLRRKLKCGHESIKLNHELIKITQELSETEDEQTENIQK